MRLLSIAVVFALAGCPIHRKPDSPKAPDVATAIAGINSPFDDFNSADPSPYWLHHLVFSTNRGSEGANFDLYSAQLSWQTGSLIAEEPAPFVPQLMTDRDERGPIAIQPWEWSKKGFGEMWFSITSNREGGAGGLDLYATSCAPHYHPHREGPCKEATELVPLTALNSSADDAYLSKPFTERDALFASNREGSREMDIYAARWDGEKTLVDAPAAIERVDALSSDADDTAPFVIQKYEQPSEVVFVSSREGGLGEHDIYCSRFDKGQWTAPKNLGPSVNSAKDEYRPNVIQVGETRFLVFSSTREGGQGGYDLYIVGWNGCR